jgi:hypothetical protein
MLGLVEQIDSGTALPDAVTRSDFFRCAACGKVHMKQTGKVCPCGEPFPNDVKEVQYR